MVVRVEGNAIALNSHGQFGQEVLQGVHVIGVGGTLHTTGHACQHAKAEGVGIIGYACGSLADAGAGRAVIPASPLVPVGCSAGAGAAAPAMKSTMEDSASGPDCRDVVWRWAVAALVSLFSAAGGAGLAAGSVDATLPKSFRISLPVAVRGNSLGFCTGCTGSEETGTAVLRSGSVGPGLGQGIVPRGFAAVTAGSGIWSLAPVAVLAGVFRSMADVRFAACSTRSAVAAGFGETGMGSPTHSPWPDRLGLTYPRGAAASLALGETAAEDPASVPVAGVATERGVPTGMGSPTHSSPQLSFSCSAAPEAGRLRSRYSSGLAVGAAGGKGALTGRSMASPILP